MSNLNICPFNPNINSNIKELAWLLGKWIGKNGKGMYPTIKPFKYTEVLEITEMGQPNFHYSSITHNADTQMVMHRETGFIRLSPDKTILSLIIAQNSGIVTIEEAEINDGPSLTFFSKDIGRISFAKEPSVTKIKRIFTLINEKSLSQQVFMSTSKTKDLTEHLKIDYVRE